MRRLPSARGYAGSSLRADPGDDQADDATAERADQHRQQPHRFSAYA